MLYFCTSAPMKPVWGSFVPLPKPEVAMPAELQKPAFVGVPSTTSL